MRYDVIVPLFNIQEDIGDYISNWFEEIPINNLYLGLGKDSLENDSLLEYIPIDQTKNKTLGMCIADLMKHVTTDWFVYLHSDVKIAEFNFQIMENYIDSHVGAIEGSPILVRDGKRSLLGRHWQERAYSGFQVFRTEAVQYIINKIEDDYIYRNEDLIFQNAVIDMGFQYQKAMSTYYHINEGGYVRNEKDSRGQLLGLIKYAQPTNLMGNLIIATMNFYLRTYKEMNFQEIQEFTQENNPKWLNLLRSPRIIKR